MEEKNRIRNLMMLQFQLHLKYMQIKKRNKNSNKVSNVIKGIKESDSHSDVGY